VLSLGVVLSGPEEVQATGRFGVGVIVDGAGLSAANGEAAEGPAPVFRIWYPSAANGRGWTEPGLRAFVQERLAIASPAPAAVGPKGFPVLVGIPGWDGTRVENTTLVRELASHGFVVATLEYPLPMPDAAHSDRPAYLRRPMDFSSEAAFNDTVRRGDELTRARARDAIGVLDRLARLNRSDPGGRFSHRLDLGRAGVFGFSLGGAAAAQACWQDDRFRAAVNMDGWQFADAAQHGLRRPYLLLGGDAALPTERDLTASDPVHRYMSVLTVLDYQRNVRNFRKYGGLYVAISGGQHLNFAGQVTLSSQRNAGIAVRRLLEIVNTYVLAFFQKYLNGVDSPLLTADSPTMPEAHLQVWTVDAVNARVVTSS